MEKDKQIIIRRNQILEWRWEKSGKENFVRITYHVWDIYLYLYKTKWKDKFCALMHVSTWHTTQFGQFNLLLFLAVGSRVGTNFAKT